ncbi:Cytochrome P450 [Mycena sanguinolenta]|uniref:Cytochrome P450 n=1 Tax=Mycena sanguinolenta TaxID=230812 RepID=A0A8H6YQ09_9AGAR|nr:Cytochrome P450 [Mycena sanguinolenta]
MAVLEIHSAALSAFVVCSGLLCVFFWPVKRSKLPLPPGPKKLPLVGNLLDVPATMQWEKWAHWSKEYKSDIIHLDLAGTSVIVLSSVKATEDLLEKRSAIYSDRNDFTMVTELMGFDYNIGLMKYGDQWRTHRRLFNQALNSKMSQTYWPQELHAIRNVLRRLLQTPDNFLAHFKLMSGETIMSIAYGIQVTSSDDPYVSLAVKANTFPILKYVPSWFPGAGFKRQAAKWRVLARGMMEIPFAETKRQMECGTAPRSFTYDALERLRDSGDAYYEEDVVKATAGTMFIGAADTTPAALGTLVLAMLANPEAQRKAQAEIDSVTGGRRLPDFGDQEFLPYVSAIVKGGTALEERISFRNAPCSMVIGNTWAMLHDEDMYPDPHTFKPERFLLPNGMLNHSVKDPDAAFGYGRRRCPGRHLATSTIWITAANVLATFNINKAVDELGNTIEPTYEYTSGVLTAPVPFKCSITPRSSGVVELIQGIDTKYV